jgi:hypothetical protein
MAVVSTVPSARAALRPPPGTAFTGWFWFNDDAYNYLSFAQQAEDGAFVFRNKLYLPPHAPALVNPEWWAVGALSRLLGRHPILAYRLLGLGALLALVAALHAWLRDTGLPVSHAFAALLLLCVGGGGGAPCLWLGTDGGQCLDVRSGLFPFLEILANPHFVVGTALLLWSLRLFRAAHEHGGLRPLLAAAALATLLGLTRPYDLVLLAAVRSLVVALTDPPSRWIRHALAMALLLPVVAYDAWVFRRVPAFAWFTGIAYVFPGRGEFAEALAPAALLGIAAWAVARARGVALLPADRPRRVAALHFVVWLALALLVIAVRPVSFSLQFLVGVGVPLLALVALALAPFPPGATLLAAAGLGSAAAAALWITLLPGASWYVPAERMAAARALRAHCRPGDLVLSPPDIGRYASAFSACSPYVSHPAAPGFAERDAEVRRFYEEPDPASGQALLDRACVAHLVLPATASLAVHAGPGAPFRAVETVGQAPRAITLYSRMAPPACASAP